MSANFIRASQAPASAAQRHAALCKYYANMSHVAALCTFLGFKPSSDMPAECQELARYVILVCFDLEHSSDNTDNTTEFGIANLSQNAVRVLVASGNVGDHGQKLLQMGWYYFYRIQENSHMVSNTPWKNPMTGGTAFGLERYANVKELQAILKATFKVPITNSSALQGCYRPIIVLGHAVGHDIQNIRDKTIAFNIDAQGTVVKTIDTQQLVRDVGTWDHPNNNIGLKPLVESLGF
jgi:hypothetical protein